MVSQEALKHVWLSGENATDHNLLPEIKAYMAKARLRRGIEIIKLANRIEALRMQEDEEEDSAEQADVPENAKAAAGDALSRAPAGHATEANPPAGASKKTLSSIAKGAIFREVVLAKVREMKAADDAAQMELEAQERANSASASGGSTAASTIRPNKKSG